ncbi:MAG: lipopolysaccharide biosynthesis protein [Hyphomicrobiales bacterium]|nr:lipopolysaccharide biosynthesis protein [Hyphomicrobiales bacterium]
MNFAPPPQRSYLREAFSDADLDLGALGAALWRERLKILRPTLLVALITFLVVFMIPAKYQAESRLLLLSHDNIYLRSDLDKDVLDRNVVDPEAVVSQAQIVLSRDLAKEVIAKLQLNELPEFDPALSGVSLVKSILGFFGIVKNPLAMTPEERVLEAYYERLTVFPVEKSRVIVIDFLSENPELAARVANAIAAAYLERQQAAKQEQAKSAGVWLGSQIDELRKKVAEADNKVEAFRAKSNLLVGPNNTTLSTQHLGDLNAQLAAARAQKADAEAKAKLIRGMLKSGQPIDSSDILNSELIRRLSEQRVTLRAQLAEQSSSLLDNHPRIKELKAQIADLDQQIRNEAETIARSLENDAKLADAKVAAQLANFDALKSQAATTNEDDVQLRALERDAKSQRDLLESYLAKYREASARDTVASAPPDARIISRATVSNIPAYPKKLPTVMIASLATMVLCAGLVLTRELLATPAGAMQVPTRAPRFFGGGDPLVPDVKVSGPATMAAAPDVPPASAENNEINPAAPDSRAKRYTEIVRTPAPIGVPVSAIEEFAHNLQQVGFAGSQMVFFSAAPEVETAGIAIKFARAMARDARTVLVGLGAGDAAIRDISSDPGAPSLTDLATGAASFGAIITKDRTSTLNLIASGDGSRHSLVATPGMAQSFAALSKAYSHVIVDVGVLGGPDMTAIARLVPHAALVVETLSGLATQKARDSLIEAGFEDVTILVSGRAEAHSSGMPAHQAAA